MHAAYSTTLQTQLMKFIIYQQHVLLCNIHGWNYLLSISQCAVLPPAIPSSSIFSYSIHKICTHRIESLCILCDTICNRWMLHRTLLSTFHFIIVVKSISHTIQTITSIFIIFLLQFSLFIQNIIYFIYLWLSFENKHLIIDFKLSGSLRIFWHLSLSIGAQKYKFTHIRPTYISVHAIIAMNHYRLNVSFQNIIQKYVIVSIASKLLMMWIMKYSHFMFKNSKVKKMYEN